MSNLILALYVFTTSLGLIVLKLGATTSFPITYIENRLHFNFNVYTLSGLALYATSFALYVYLISKFDLGYIIPLTTGFVYVVIFIASFLLFKEVFTVTKIMGIALILGGLILLNLKR